MYLGGNRPLGGREKPHSHQLLIPFNIISILHVSSILNFGIQKCTISQHISIKKLIMCPSKDKIEIKY